MQHEKLVLSFIVPLFILLFGERAFCEIAHKTNLDWAVVTFHSPHLVRTPQAKLNRKLLSHIDKTIKGRKLSTTKSTIGFALDITSQSLYFGLGHKTILFFTRKSREGNCIEYSHLFATIFDRASRKAGLETRCFVVRSLNPKVLGFRVPLKSFRDHDWNLVVDYRSKKRWYIDPSFHDVGLDWNISSRIKGKINLPVR